MKLTKRERHKHYKLALESIKNDTQTFACCALQYSFKTPEWWYGLDRPEKVSSIFTEFGKKKPKNRSFVWWPDNKEGKNKRIKALEECIEETKPKSNGVSGRKRVSKRISISPRKKTNRRGATVVRRMRKKSKAS